MLFRNLAIWARNEVIALKKADASEEEFACLVAAEACRLAAAMNGGKGGERCCAVDSQSCRPVDMAQVSDAEEEGPEDIQP